MNGKTRPHFARTDPATAAEDAIILLGKGRVSMAIRALEGTPARIREVALSAGSLGWLQGYGAGLAAGSKKSGNSRKEGRAAADKARLARLCALPEGRALARAVLKVEDRDLDAVLAGRVRLAPSAWKRLWGVVA